MPRPTDHPLLYELNTRVWLSGLGCTLADVPDHALDDLAARGVDAVWLMGVWTGGPRARLEALSGIDLRGAYDVALPGWCEDDVGSSPYAVAEYSVAPELGGDTGLAVLRRRLAERGMGLVLDFVPNHVGLDHSWLSQHPEWLVSRPAGQGGAGVRSRDRIVAHGRDPYFAPWSDTLQIEHRSRGVRAALSDLVLDLTGRCDGLRCDMAMLVLSDIFARTWADWPPPADPAEGELWPEVIARVRCEHPGFLFIAEAYWELEYRLQQLGFDYVYDKRLYDRLTQRDAEAVRGHLRADDAYARRLVRFVENHDEPRAASIWAPPAGRAAAVTALTIPGARLVHDGQSSGHRLRLPVQLRRGAVERPDEALSAFYDRLFAALASDPPRRGAWRLLETSGSVLAWTWDAGRLGRWLVVVNLGDEARSTRLAVPLIGLEGRRLELTELLGGAPLTVEPNGLSGLELTLGPWDARIYAVV